MSRSSVFAMTRRELEQEVLRLRDLVCNADESHKEFQKQSGGVEYGLLDAIDNSGNLYQSQWAYSILRRVRK